MRLRRFGSHWITWFGASHLPFGRQRMVITLGTWFGLLKNEEMPLKCISPALEPTSVLLGWAVNGGLTAHILKYQNYKLDTFNRGLGSIQIRSNTTSVYLCQKMIKCTTPCVIITWQCHQRWLNPTLFYVFFTRRKRSKRVRWLNQKTKWKNFCHYAAQAKKTIP